MGDIRYCRDVQEVVLGICDGLSKEGLGIWLDRSLPTCGISWIVYEGHRDAELRQGVMEEVESAPIKRGGRDDVITCLCHIQDRKGRRC